MNPAPIEAVLVAAAAAVAVAIAIRSPFHAFCVLIVTLPFEDALAFDTVFTVTLPHLAMLLLIGVCAFHGRREAVLGRLRSPLHPLVLIYLGVCLLSLVMTIVAPPPEAFSIAAAGWRTGALRSVIQVSLLLFLSLGYFATVFFCATPRRLKLALTIYLATAALIALYGLYQMVGVLAHVPAVSTNVQSYFDAPASFRPNSTFKEPLLFGHYLLTALPLAVSLFLHRDRLRREDRVRWGLGLLPAITLMAAALLTTVARGAWFGFIGAMGALVIVTVRTWGWRSVVRAAPAAAVISIAAAVAMRAAHPSWRDMFWSIANRFAFFDPSNIAGEQRLPFIPFLLGLAKDYPVLGVGYGNYPFYQLDRFGGDIAGAYGLFFQALVETGLLGLAALAALIGAFYVQVWRALGRARNTEWAPWLAGCLAGLTGLLIQYFTFGDRMAQYVWVFIGLTMAIVNLANAASAAPEAAPRMTAGATEIGGCIRTRNILSAPAV